MDFNRFRSIFQYPSADPNYFNSNVHVDFQTLGFEIFKEEYMSMSFDLWPGPYTYSEKDVMM